MVRDDFDRLVRLGLFERASQLALQYASEDRLPIPQCGVASLGVMVQRVGAHNPSFFAKVVECFAMILNDKAAPIKSTVLDVVKSVHSKEPTIFGGRAVDALVPPLMRCVKEKNIAVKLAAEKVLGIVLALDQGQDVLKTYLAAAEGSLAKTLADYHARVLSKLNFKETAVDDDSMTSLLPRRYVNTDV